MRQVTGRYNQIKNRKEIENKVEIYIQKIQKIQKYTRHEQNVFTATPSWIICDTEPLRITETVFDKTTMIKWGLINLL